jgi:hypothetical protein
MAKRKRRAFTKDVLRASAVAEDAGVPSVSLTCEGFDPAARLFPLVGVSAVPDHARGRGAVDLVG